MTIGVFLPKNNDEHVDMLLAFAKGIRACGHEPLLLDVKNYQPVDYAVVFGIGKRDVPISWPRGEVIRQQRARGKDVIIIEKGFVRRNEYYMAGLNGLNNRAEFCNQNCPQDRWRALDVELKPFHGEGRKVVVCGQVPSDASVQHVDIIQWCTQTVQMLRKLTSRPIVFRPHPLALDRTPAICGAKTSTNSLAHDLEDAWAVVTFNSNVATEALIAGIPAMSFDEGSMTFGITGHDLGRIGEPLVPTYSLRQRWANDIAYTQWNKEEFECGLPWLHLTNSKRAGWRETQSEKLVVG